MKKSEIIINFFVGIIILILFIFIIVYINKTNTPELEKIVTLESKSFSSYSHEMVFVPSGVFYMGTNLGQPDEKPAHKVYVDGFWIDKYPVTNIQYKRFIEETGHRIPQYWDDEKCNAPFQPVVGVSWDDANAYCEWLTKKTGQKYRLPTEAEFEKAARGIDGRIYPWGNQPPNSKLVNCELQERIPEVGTYKNNVSPYGCYDMVGSVWHWCQDWYDSDYYRKSPIYNPKGPDTISKRGRVVRGGNWVFLGCCSDSLENSLRVTRREAFNQNILKKVSGSDVFVKKIIKKTMKLQVSKEELISSSLAGAIIGIISSLLTKLGNPIDGGISIACFERDIAGALGLHQIIQFSYIRPEIIGIVLGVFIVSILKKNINSVGGSSTILRFFISMIISFGVFVFIGCPMRLCQRIAGGDPQL